MQKAYEIRRLVELFVKLGLPVALSAYDKRVLAEAGILDSTASLIEPNSQNRS